MQGRELFGLAPDDKLSYEKILSLIHPEDIDQFRQVMRSTAQSGEYARTDFRIVSPDGTVRWITSRGRSYAKTPGNPVRMMGVALDITERKHLEEELQMRLKEITELKKQIEKENLYLKEEFKLLSEPSEMVGQSKEMLLVFQKIEQVAPTDSHVLITGETGTGKETGGSGGPRREQTEKPNHGEGKLQHVVPHTDRERALRP